MVQKDKLFLTIFMLFVCIIVTRYNNYQEKRVKWFNIIFLIMYRYGQIINYTYISLVVFSIVYCNTENSILQGLIRYSNIRKIGNKEIDK